MNDKLKHFSTYSGMMFVQISFKQDYVQKEKKRRGMMREIEEEQQPRHFLATSIKEENKATKEFLKFYS